MSLTIRSSSSGMDNQGVNLVKKAIEMAQDGELSSDDITALEKTANSDKNYTDNEKAFIASLKSQGSEFVQKIKAGSFDPSTFAWEIADEPVQATGDPAKKEPEAPVSFALSRDISRNLGTGSAISTGDPQARVSVAPASTSLLPPNYRSLSYDQLKGVVNTPDAVAALAGQLESDPNNGYDTERGKPFGGDGPLGSQAPERTWERFNTPGDKSGVCRDIHQIAGSLLPPEYEARQIGYVAGRTSHSLLVYKDPKSGGYGVVEYGRNYSADDIAKALGGRKAHSYEEALMAIRPEAKVIFRWSNPEKGKEGHVESVFYTQGQQNYFESLNLKFGEKVPTYAFNFDSNQGLSVSGAVGDFRAKAGFNPLSPGDPTGQGAVYGTVGYGHSSSSNPNNWWGLSLGVNHRPNESSGAIGANTDNPNATTLVGARFDWHHNPFGSQRLGNDHVRGGFNWGGTLGVGLPFNQGKKTDAGTTTPSTGFDNDLLTGMIQANAKLSYDVTAQLTPRLTLGGSAFVAPDIYLTTASIGMGNTHPLGNVGANLAARYADGPWAVTAQAQYVPYQVNNLDNTGIRTDVSYTRGRFNFSAGTGVIDSHEGPRLTAYQNAGVTIVPKYLNLNLSGQQQVVFPSGDKAYMPPGGSIFGLSLGGNL